MAMQRTIPWAARTQHLKASAIRELLKLTARPEVISFAGGLPATETLPGEIDALVYELYGLTEDEIRVVEGQ